MLAVLALLAPRIASASSFSITSPSAATAAAGSYFFYQMTTSGPAVSMSMSGQPDSLYFDSFTGTLSGFAPNTPGVFYITMTAFDGTNTAFGFLTLTVGAGDTTPPVITLNGSNPMTVSKGSTLTDPGAYVTDNIDPPQTIYGTGSVNTSVVGSYTLNYSVTDAAGNSASTTRTVNVVASTNANLSTLALSSGTLSPSFAAATTSYTASVDNALDSITVTPTVGQTDATVQVRANSGSFSSVTSGSASGALSLNVGSNTVDVRVTAEDGTTTKTYTVTVTRAASSNADLSALALSSGTLSPSFAASTTSYAASVANAVSSITVTPTVAEANASVKVNNSAVMSGSASNAIALNVGTNEISVVVTAQDGSTAKTYTVTVTRAADTTAPTITLLGANPLTIAIGASFSDPGATVTDDFDPPRAINGAGSVDTSSLGSYTLTYEASDAAGNPATPVTRTVTVVEAPKSIGAIGVGGGVQTAGDALNVAFVGSPGAVATADSGNTVARQGAVGMVYFSNGYVVAADAPTIKEASSAPESSTHTTLSARELFDDGTFAVPAQPVTWSPVTNQVITVSAEGVAQANAVYQNTLAAFTGTIGSTAATNFVTVLNTLPDNYGAWAGDTFDDTWEISQGMSGAVNPTNLSGGVPAWLLYAMGLNPAQSAPATLAPPATNSGYFTISYTRNPYATNYTFTVQESGSLSGGFADMVDPVSSTNAVNGTNQITTRGSVPMNATNKQFLRIKILQPAP